MGSSILLLAPDPRGTPGGADTYNRRLVQALVQAGHDAAIVHPADRARIPPHATLVVDGACLALFASLPPPAAALIHHPSPFNAPWPPAARAALAFLPRVIATNAPCAERLHRDYGVAAPVLISAGQDLLPRHRRPATGCTLLAIGPLVPRRAHDVLLRALARLGDLDWRLILAGDSRRDPAHAGALAALAQASGIAERIALVPAAAEPEWAAADLLVLAHPVAGLDGAPAEASRRGLPVVLGGCAGNPPAIIGTPPGDADALSRVLRRLMFDRALFDRAAEASWMAGQALPDWAEQARAFMRALG